MGSDKAVGYVLLGVIGVAGVLWLRASLANYKAQTNARAVTSSAKEGGLVTSPVYPPDRLGMAAPESPLAFLNRLMPATNRSAGSLQANSLTDYRVPYGNRQSAAAAFSADKATNVSNYKPSAWASLNFNSGVV